MAFDTGFLSTKASSSNSASNTGRVMMCWASISMASRSDTDSLRSSRISFRKSSKNARASLPGRPTRAVMRVICRSAISATSPAQSSQ